MLTSMQKIPRKTYLLLFLLIIPGLLTAADPSLPQLPADMVVARVNNVELRGDALNEYVGIFLPNLAFHGKVRPEKIGEYRRKALDRMILHELIYQDAIRRGIRAAPDKIEAEINLTRRRFRTEESFQKALAARGLTLEYLRRLAERNLKVAEVVRRDITSRNRIPDKQIRDTYSRNMERFHQPESILLRHILFKRNTEQAEEIRRMALSNNTPREFERLACKYSEGDYRVKGGLLGWVHRGRLDPELEKAVFDLREGQVSRVVKTSAGLHLLRVEKRRAARQVPFEEVREKINAQLMAKKTEQLREELRQRVFQNAKVEILAKF